MGSQVLLPALDGLVLEDVRLSNGVVHLDVRCVAATTLCSTCWHLSG